MTKWQMPRNNTKTINVFGLLDFVLTFREGYEVNWHHRVVAEYLTRFAKQDITRLILAMPPRMGKSELASRYLPAYIFCEINPNAKIIGTGYNYDIASSFNRDVQRIMLNPKLKDAYPNIRLNERNARYTSEINYLRNNDIFEIVDYKGSYISAGRGGAVTGFGADYIIIDDPYKNRKEAYSPKVQKEVLDWYRTVLYTRLEGPKASICIIATRWYSEDLSGTLINEMQDGQGDVWTVVTFPQYKVNEDNRDDPRSVGEVLWPNKFPPDFVAKKKFILGDDFYAVEQQEPLDKALLGLDASKLEIVLTLPSRQGATFVRYWDKAYTASGGAYTAGILLGFFPSLDCFIILDIRRGQWGDEERERNIKQIAAIDKQVYGYVPIFIEQEPGAGKFSAQYTIKQLFGYEAYADPPDRSKEARHRIFASHVNMFHVKLLSADWNQAFIDECKTLRYKDQLDAVSGALMKMTLGWDSNVNDITSLAVRRNISPF